jgi:hypothetical protein
LNAESIAKALSVVGEAGLTKKEPESAAAKLIIENYFPDLASITYNQ